MTKHFLWFTNYNSRTGSFARRKNQASTRFFIDKIIIKVCLHYLACLIIFTPGHICKLLVKFKFQCNLAEMPNQILRYCHFIPFKMLSIESA